MSYETIPSTIHQLNESFAGRLGTVGYMPERLIHIHRRNRPYVWNIEMQQNLIDSLLKGYYIPPIICSHSIVNGVEKREVMEGGNRITTFRRILSGEVRPRSGFELTAEERMKVSMSSIAVVVMRGLSNREQIEMFRRLNKNIKVSDGQLYAMSVEDSPLVREAMSLLNDDDYPLRRMITKHFFDTRNADNDGKKQLENAVALVSGALNGANYITKSYNVQEAKVESQQPIDRDIVVMVLGRIFSIFDLADETEPSGNAKHRKSNWSIGKMLGAMLYDYHTGLQGQEDAIRRKWADYIVSVRRCKSGAEDAVKLAGAQNLNATRYRKVCAKVAIYVAENRLAHGSELSWITHQQVEVDDIVEDDEDEEEVNL